MQMTTPSKRLICVSNPYQATVNYWTYLFSNKPKLLPDKCIVRLWWTLIENICH